MANKASASASSGIGIGTVCFIVLVILKVMNIAPIASWSWLKVILLPVAISFIPALIVLCFWIIGFLFLWLFSRK